MCFKRVFGAWAMLAFALSGCGVKVGEKPPEQTPVSYSGRNYTCVGQIPQHIQKYMNDELNDQQITEFVRCLQNAFSSFAQYTRGKEQSNYRADEIRNFLQKSFIRDRTISDELLHEFMVIKQALVGGDQQRIARGELFEAIEFLDDLRAEAIRLRPHIRVLNPKLVEIDRHEPRELGDRLAAANSALQQSIRTVAAHLEKTKHDYPLTNLEAFLTEFREFVRWEEHFPNARPVDKWIKLLRAFKETTVSPKDPDVIREGDWVPLLQNMSNWYLAYLQYAIGIKDKPLLHGTGLQNSIYLAKQVIDYTRGAIHSQGGNTPTLTFEQINRLVIALHDIKWIPENIRPESVDQAVRAITTRMAGDATTKPSDRRARGLDLKSLAVIEGEFYRWAYVQMIIYQRYYGVDRQARAQSVPSLQVPMMPPDIFAKIEEMAGSDWNEFIKVKEKMLPLFADNYPRVMLLPPSQRNQFGLEHGFYNLSMMNLLRTIAGLVYRGYAESSTSPWQWKSGIKGPELQAFYLDFRNIGIDLGFVDKRNMNSGSRAFVEGKLFTSTSQGLKYDIKAPDAGELSFVEAMEYFAFLYSGGQAAKDIYEELRTVECPENGEAPRDLNGAAKLNRLCVRSSLPAMIKAHLANMPYLQNYVSQLGPQELQTYSKVILDTARQPGVSMEEWVEKNELSTMAVVVHYTESILNRFDRNLDGKLNNEELGAAVPLFSGFIKKVAYDQSVKKTPKEPTILSDADARATLFFILKYKALPEMDSNKDKAIVYGYEWMEPTLVLDRLELAKVFQAIIARLMEVGAKPLPPPAPPISASMPKPNFFTSFGTSTR